MTSMNDENRIFFPIREKLYIIQPNTNIFKCSSFVIRSLTDPSYHFESSSTGTLSAGRQKFHEAMRLIILPLSLLST